MTWDEFADHEAIDLNEYGLAIFDSREDDGDLNAENDSQYFMECAVHWGFNVYRINDMDRWIVGQVPTLF